MRYKKQIRPKSEQETEDHAFSISEIFHENSKQRRYDIRFHRRIGAINSNPQIHEFTSKAFKRYAGADVYQLPREFSNSELSFDDVILQRRSIREFARQRLSLSEVAKLLYFSNGITGMLEPKGAYATQYLRASPSGGALYPIEIYFIALRVEELRKGIYHYCVRENQLECIAYEDVTMQLVRLTHQRALIEDSAGVIVLTGIFERTKFKYGERGYRFVLFEVGHVAQNILLVATSMKLGSVAVGGFIDDEINQILDIDGVDESTLYMIAIGKQKGEQENSVRHLPNFVL